MRFPYTIIPLFCNFFKTKVKGTRITLVSIVLQLLAFLWNFLLNAFVFASTITSDKRYPCTCTRADNSCHFLCVAFPPRICRVDV